MTSSMKPRLTPIVVGAGVALLGLSSAHAATTTATFTVTATVSSTCSITANPLAFGVYTGVQLDGASTLSATCSNLIPYDVGLSAGTFSGATVTARKMSGLDPAGLGYSLFRDSARTLNWGETIGSDVVHQTGNGVAQTIPVFGRVPAAELVDPGSYTDTITVTLTF